VETTQIKNEMDRLETGIRRYNGDDLPSLKYLLFRVLLKKQKLRP
jgi:hypothetical protein